MDNVVLFNKISLLPENVKQEVNDFLDKLLAKVEQKREPKKANTGFGALKGKIIIKGEPSFGSAKGKIIMSPDFDEPLECFKDYM